MRVLILEPSSGETAPLRESLAEFSLLTPESAQLDLTLEDKLRRYFQRGVSRNSYEWQWGYKRELETSSPTEWRGYGPMK